MGFRVMVCGLRGLAGELVEQAIDRTAGLRLLRPASVGDPLAVAGNADPDVIVLIVEGDELPKAWRTLHEARAGRPIVTVDPRRGAATVHLRGGKGRKLGDLSPAELAAAISAIGLGDTGPD